MSRIVLPLLLLLLIALAAPAAAGEGMVRLPSEHTVAATADRLVAVLEDKGINVFARVDHAAGARGVDLSLPPTELVVFGNPKIGTPLMQCARTTAIDLPMKALIWEDAEGRVWLAYNDPAWLADRHRLKGCEAALKKAERALEGLARAATTGQ